MKYFFLILSFACLSTFVYAQSSVDLDKLASKNYDNVNAYWMGHSSDWNDPLNWRVQKPVKDGEAISYIVRPAKFNPTLTGTVEARDVIVLETAEVNIAADASLKIYGLMTLYGQVISYGDIIVNENAIIRSNNNLTIQEQGNLFYGPGNPIGSGNVVGNVKFNLKAANEHSTELSSPINMGSFNILPGNLYSSSASLESQSGFIWKETLKRMQPGQAYLSYNMKELKFAGVPNNGDVRVGIKKENGLMLLGNPYSASMSIDQFLNKQHKDAAIHSAVYRILESSIENSKTVINEYSVINAVGEVSSIAGTNHSNILEVAETFLVKAHSNGQVVFENSMQEKQELREEKGIPRVKISLSGSGSSYNELLVAFHELAADEMDSFGDAPILQSDAVKFYSRIGDDKLAIQSLAPLKANKEVSLEMDGLLKGESYKFSTDLLEHFDGASMVLLEDKALKAYQQLHLDSEYEFIADESFMKDRFSLHFIAAMNVKSREESCSANDAVLYLEQESPISRALSFYDENAKLLYKVDFNNYIEISGLSAGNYKLVFDENMPYSSALNIEVDGKKQLKSDFDWLEDDIYTGQMVSFRNLGVEAKIFEWNFDDFSIPSFDKNPEHYFEKEGVYQVSLYVSNDDCNDLVFRNIEVKARSAMDFKNNSESCTASVYTHNDMLIVKQDLCTSDIKTLDIYNVMGQLIKTYSNIKPMDGFMKLRIIDLENGYYLVNVAFEDGFTITERLLIER